MQHSQLLFNLENQTKNFSYTIFPVKKNKCWKNFKIMRKLLVNFFSIHILKLEISGCDTAPHLSLHYLAPAMEQLHVILCPVRLAYQPPTSSTFLSEQTSHHQPASSTFLSEQISTSHQPPAKLTGYSSTRPHRAPSLRICGAGRPPAASFACPPPRSSVWISGGDPTMETGAWAVVPDMRLLCAYWATAKQLASAATTEQPAAATYLGGRGSGRRRSRRPLPFPRQLEVLRPCRGAPPRQGAPPTPCGRRWRTGGPTESTKKSHPRAPGGLFPRGPSLSLSIPPVNNLPRELSMEPPNLDM
jgi:hypothetical protein